MPKCPLIEFNILKSPSNRKFPPKPDLNALSSRKAHLQPLGAAMALLAGGRECDPARPQRFRRAFAELCAPFTSRSRSRRFRPFILQSVGPWLLGFVQSSDRERDGAARMKLVRWGGDQVEWGLWRDGLGREQETAAPVAGSAKAACARGLLTASGARRSRPRLAAPGRGPALQKGSFREPVCLPRGGCKGRAVSSHPVSQVP